MAQYTYVGDGNTGDGIIVQAASTGKLGFFGATPVVQQTVTAITDGSTGTAAATNGIQPLTATYNSTLLINSIATLADGIARLRTAMRNLGAVV